MHKSYKYLMLTAAAVSLTACQPDGRTGEEAIKQTARHYGRLSFHPCSLTSAASAGNVEALCARHEVPENPVQPDERRISLNIAWLEAGNQRGGTGDPVFFIAGGPGQAATEVAGIVNAALREVRKQRDIFLIDQRGTGQSNPLTCVDSEGKPLSFDETGKEEAGEQEILAQMIEYARTCAASLESRADARFYTTSEAIGDLDAVRAALGADKINLVGVSYGTRVVQQYAAHYPQHTRAIVMDGVAPNDLVVGGEFSTTLEDALKLQSEQCRELEACRVRFPTDTREQLRSVMKRLEQTSVEVDYRDPGTGESKRGKVTPDTITSLAFSFSYAPQTAALLPLIIDEAAQGRYAPLMSLSQLMSRQMEGQINRGMQWSVICAEDADRYQSPAESGDTILGTQVARMFFAPCRVWPKGIRPEGFNLPLRSDAPALLLSGELDPVTPPRYAERVLSGLPNGRHLVLQGQGHGTLMLGCMPKLLAQFMESADAAAIRSGCLDSMTYVPPFTTFNGWEP